MDTNTKDIIDSLNFIKEHMATKDELNEFRHETNERLSALESKVSGINRRLDDTAMQRQQDNLAERVTTIERHLGIAA